MTTARYGLGVVLTLIAFVPIGFGARAVRRRWFVDWSGPPARLLEMVVAVSTVVVVSEALGSVGLFRTAPIVIAFAAVGALLNFRLAPGPTSGPGAAVRAATRRAMSDLDFDEDEASQGSTPWVTWTSFVAVAAVAASWLARTSDAVRHGMTTPDTLWYHMPVAARFVQDGWTTHIHYIDGEPLTVFFPATSSLLHAVGILLMGSDLLSPFLNLGWLALALLAGWCIGRPYKMAPIAMVGVAIVMGTPVMVATQPGGAYADVFGVAMLLAAGAILLHGDRSGHAPSVAVLAAGGAALGLAFGTKYQFIVPAVVFAFGMIVLARRGVRLRATGVLLVSGVLTGSYWYFRNWFAVGNPVPAFHAHFGPISLSTPHLATPEESIAKYFFQWHIWRIVFFPGLVQALGSTYWLTLALVGLAIVFVLVDRTDNVPKLIAFVGLIAIVAYVVTPQALGTPGHPIFFRFNVRYAAAGLALALVAAPAAPALRRGRTPWLVLGIYLLALGIAQADPAIWPTNLRADRFVEPLHGVDNVAGIAIAALALVVVTPLILFPARAHLSARMAAVLAISAMTAVAIIGAPAHDYYLTHRYRHTPIAQYERSYRWARNVRDARIGVTGVAMLQYGYYGKDLSNYVQYIGKVGAHGAFSPLDTCRTWRDAINHGHYGYLVLAPASYYAPGFVELTWTKTDPSAQLVFSGLISAYRITGPMHPALCDQLPLSHQQR